MPKPRTVLLVGAAIATLTFASASAADADSSRCTADAGCAGRGGRRAR